MFSLRLLGGLELARSEGSVPGRVGQRRQLALLAALAVAGNRRTSRDKLLALFWPETETERARHLLSDTIYVLREALGEDVVSTAGDDVVLNPARITSDVAEFRSALEGSDFAKAVRIYSAGGAFLDGVHPTDSPEFERWADSVRDELAAGYRRALEQLALDAERHSSYAEAVRWWRQLAAADRLSSRVALCLLRALAAAGDRAGALEFARTHERIVRAELECEPDAAVTAFAIELRANDASRPKTGERVERLPQAQASGPVAVPRAAEAPEGRRVRQIGYGLVALLILTTIGYAAMLMRQRFGSSARGVADASVVVLPLADLTTGSAADSTSFADGLTDELTSYLARNARLRVIGSTSAFVFKGHPTDVRKVADSLHVANVLEGSIQRAGNRIRVSVRLVSGGNGVTRWSESYDRDLHDIFAMEDDIARAVAAALDMRLQQQSASRGPYRTASLAAHDFYLRGQDPTLQRSDSGARAAIDYYLRSIAADSTYAPAYAGLAHMLLTAGAPRGPGDPNDTYDKAIMAAREAVALDDSLPEAHAELAFVAMQGLFDVALAATELRRAVSLDPNARRVHEYLAILYDWMARPADAIVEAQRAVASDPLSVNATTELASALMYARRYDEALSELAKLRDVQPPVRRASIITNEILGAKGMWKEVADTFRARAKAGGSRRLSGFAGRAFALAGNRAEATNVLTGLLARQRAGERVAFDIALVYQGLGDLDHAFEWLARSFDDHSLRLNIMDPTCDDLRADPRFERVKRRLGLQKV